MSRFDKKPDPPDESWMGTYGDMVTLLLCFFILLAAVSKVDTVKFEAVQSGMTKEMGKITAERPIETMKQELQEVTKVYQAEQAMDVGTDERGLVLNLASNALFAPGSATIREEVKPLLKEVVATLVEPRFQSYVVEVQGHTDDVPSSSPQFPTNWELSAGRATATVRLLIEMGVSPARLTGVAHADTAPRVVNRLPDGTALPDNQALNRRVSIHIFPR